MVQLRLLGIRFLLPAERRDQQGQRFVGWVLMAAMAMLVTILEPVAGVEEAVTVVETAAVAAVELPVEDLAETGSQHQLWNGSRHCFHSVAFQNTTSKSDGG